MEEVIHRQLDHQGALPDTVVIGSSVPSTGRLRLVGVVGIARRTASMNAASCASCGT